MEIQAVTCYIVITMIVFNMLSTQSSVITYNSNILSSSDTSRVTERMTCALRCLADNCEAFVVESDVSNFMCSYFQRNRNPPGERYLSGDIRMCHFLPKGTTSGVYTITPSDLITTDVYCDMDTVGGGWTVIQNRFDGSQDFYQNWEAYKQGFGSPYGEYWIGNEDLYLLTSSGSYELRIEMENAAGVSKFAKYSAFSVSSESANYKLEVFGYSGSADDSLVLHNTKQFSTFDRDNNEADDNCAVIYQGAWWYNHCHRSNLNGPYNPYAADNSKAMTWYGFESGQGFATLRTSKMMIRPR